MQNLRSELAMQRIDFSGSVSFALVLVIKRRNSLISLLNPFLTICASQQGTVLHYKWRIGYCASQWTIPKNCLVLMQDSCLDAYDEVRLGDAKKFCESSFIPQVVILRLLSLHLTACIPLVADYCAARSQHNPSLVATTKVVCILVVQNKLKMLLTPPTQIFQTLTGMIFSSSSQTSSDALSKQESCICCQSGDCALLTFKIAAY